MFVVLNTEVHFMSFINIDLSKTSAIMSMDTSHSAWLNVD